MSDFVWWALFLFLTFLLLVLTFRLCWRVINDVYCDARVPPDTSSDIEDLTRYKTDFRTIFKDVEMKDETDQISLKVLHVVPKEEERMSDAVVEEANETKKVEQHAEPEQDSTEEDVTHYTEEERQVLDQILGIKGEVDIYAKEIPYCLGGKKHLQYFEINQHLIMSSIALGAVDCKESDEMKKRKHMLSVYIQDCQEELKKKGEEYV